MEVNKITSVRAEFWLDYLYKNKKYSKLDMYIKEIGKCVDKLDSDDKLSIQAKGRIQGMISVYKKLIQQN